MAKKTPPTLPEVFAHRLLKVRKEKGWSQARLAERLTELGHAMHQTTIAKIERAGRAVTLGEAFAFAFALEVSPTTMFVPVERGAAVTVAPKVVAPAGRVRSWIRGVTPLGVADFPVKPRFFFEQVSDDEFHARHEYEFFGPLVGIVGGLEDAAASDDVEALRVKIRALLDFGERALQELDEREAG